MAWDNVDDFLISLEKSLATIKWCLNTSFK